MIQYKGCTGRITAVDEKRGLIHGRVAGITDMITSEGLPEDGAVVEKLWRYESLGERYRPTELLQKLATEGKGFYPA